MLKHRQLALKRRRWGLISGNRNELYSQSTGLNQQDRRFARRRARIRRGSGHAPQCLDADLSFDANTLAFGFNVLVTTAEKFKYAAPVALLQAAALHGRRRGPLN